MDQNVPVYLGTIAAIGFVLKTSILFNVQIKSKASQAFVVLCLFFIFQNAVEFLGYFTYLKSVAVGEFMIHLYMLSVFFIFPSLLVLALSLTCSPVLRQARLLLYAISGLITLAYINGLVVDSFVFLGWSVITEPGPLYWPAMSYVLICGLGALGQLLYQYLTNKNPEIRHNARITLLAFSPIMLVAVAVLGLRAAGFNSSSAVSMPLATLAFLYVMLLHTNGNLFWFSTKLKSILVIMKMDRNSSLEDIAREIEKVRIREALKLTEGQQKGAAEILGLPASTLNKRLSKYDINAEHYK